MLRWRLLLGTLIIAVLVAIGWLDQCAEVQRTAIPGIWFFPVVLAFCLVGTGEVILLARSGGMRPLPWVVYLGNLLIVTANWTPLLGKSGLLSWRVLGNFPSRDPLSAGDCVLLALGVGVFLAFVGEMLRYEKPGGAAVNLAATVFALVYVGVLLSFAIQLRLAWGVGSLASLLIVVKMGDVGAYTVGRLLGRHKMAPVLSPNKTVEGAIGALIFSCAASWATFRWMIPATSLHPGSPGPWWGWIAFGIAVCTTGMLGDLAESLIKRDVQQKDSAHWIPGFGGVLDLLDSVLLAAPAAYACWAIGLAGG